jgi:hypothetical protein
MSSTRIPQPERVVRRVQAGRQPADEETQGPFANQLIKSKFSVDRNIKSNFTLILNIHF